ncbi:DUF2690 domain-containing protein [Streptomyces sp. NPDC051597]|uniref:helix-turn-helix domain-containing protein n=1 Tax=Streptomyces sp. NPDC051597 TaxID=3155049 RepID=UPI00341B3ADA
MTAPAPECVALAEGLREMRARTGLSLAALAERTTYSKSSWERYLNGKVPVPRQAIEALCAMAGEPAGRLLALWELADAEWSGRARQTRPAAPSPPGSSPTPTAAVGTTNVPGRTRRPWVFVAGAALAAVAVATMLAATTVRGHSAGQPAVLTSPVLDPAPGCHGKTCDGKDPTDMFCGALPGRADSLGAQHLTRTGTRVEIRYSPVCAAAWGRLWHAKVGDAIEISAPGTRTQRVVISNPADASSYHYTAMVGGPDRAGLRLCFTAKDATGRECFGP